ncbi:MAG: HD-GYP domain-containing protein, partial [Chloroflexi bacterium]|nr:HD-GYP domain-containing protein [Chloroflexota bacterium]
PDGPRTPFGRRSGPILENVRMPVAAKAVTRSALIALLAAPLALFALLQALPALNMATTVPFDHFFIVVVTTATALPLAGAVLYTALSLRHTPTFLLGLAFLTIAGVFLVHGVSTPGIVLGPNNLTPISARLSLLAGGILLAGSVWIADGWLSRWISQRMGWLLAFWCAALLAFGLAALLSVAWEAGWNNSPSDHHDHGGAPTAAASPALPAAPETPAVADPDALPAGILNWLPVASYPLSTVVFATAFTMYGAAAVGYWKLYQQTHLRLVGAMAIAAVLLLEEEVALQFGHTWRLDWWLYHVVMLAGFILGVGALLWDYWRERSMRRIIEGMYKLRSLTQLELEYTDAIAVLAAAIEAKDPYTQGHTVRVAELACRLGQDLRLPPPQLRTIARSGLLHDIGKLGIPDAVLNKPGPLDSQETVVMREHPRLGHDILRRIGRLDAEIDIILSHHERMDGAGYPRGLAGEQIPLEARVVAVADVYDALTTDRPYRHALPHEVAMAMIRESSGPHLDPRCVEALERVLGAATASSARPRR